MTRLTEANNRVLHMFEMGELRVEELDEVVSAAFVIQTGQFTSTMASRPATSGTLENCSTPSDVQKVSTHGSATMLSLVAWN